MASYPFRCGWYRAPSLFSQFSHWRMRIPTHVGLEPVSRGIKFHMARTYPNGIRGAFVPELDPLRLVQTADPMGRLVFIGGIGDNGDGGALNGELSEEEPNVGDGEGIIGVRCLIGCTSLATGDGVGWCPSFCFNAFLTRGRKNGILAAMIAACCSTWPHIRRFPVSFSCFLKLDSHSDNTHSRTDEAAIATMPIEKMPASSRRRRAGMLCRLRMNGMGRIQIMQSVTRVKLALTYHMIEGL